MFSLGRSDDLALEVTCLGGHVLHVGGQPAGLVHGLRERLAHLLGRGTGQQLVFLEKLDELHQVVGTLDGGKSRPSSAPQTPRQRRLDIGFGRHGKARSPPRLPESTLSRISRSPLSRNSPLMKSWTSSSFKTLLLILTWSPCAYRMKTVASGGLFHLVLHCTR